MGTYVQFIIECKLKDETPLEVINCIKDMIDGIKNPLFVYCRNPLWNYRQSNDYPASFNNLVLKAHGDIKLFLGTDDIGSFIYFIKPYIEIGFLENRAFAKTLYDDCREEYNDWEYYFTNTPLETH